jgi:histidinol-phosphatase (PHP family)
MEEMVISAITKGFNILGFTSHAPFPNEESWTMNPESVDLYFHEFYRLKEKYFNDITLYVGLEIDYIPGIGFTDENKKLLPRLDYYIGSVHSLGTVDGNKYYFVDDTPESFSEGISILFENNVQKAVETYYKNIMSLAEIYKPDIIGHIDIIKKNNKNNKFFNENDDWYINAVQKCLKIIKENDCIVELNTGGIIRYGKECMYPSDLILKECKKNNIKVTVNSDAHSVDGMNYHFDEVEKLLLETGYNYIYILSNGNWIKKEIG